MTRSCAPHKQTDCFTCQHRDRTEWCALSEDELRQFNDSKRSRAYLPGETIYHQGDACDGVYCIESGMVGIRKTGFDGSSTLLGLGFPTNTLGYRALLAGQDHIAGAEALKPSVLCFIEAKVVRDLLSVNPALGIQFLERAARDLGEAEEKFHQSVTLSVRARLAHLLVVLQDRYGSPGQDGAINLDLPLARQDIAAMIGTRPETLARTIRRMEEDGVARFAGRRVHVPRIENLIDEIESDTFS